MSPEDFAAWLDEMRAAGLARSDADCARLLKISRNSVVTMKEKGANVRTALACAALLAGLEPYAPGRGAPNLVPKLRRWLDVVPSCGWDDSEIDEVNTLRLGVESALCEAIPDEVKP